MEAFKEESVGINFLYRFDGGGLFRPTRLNTPTKVQVNSALNASFRGDMQTIMDLQIHAKNLISRLAPQKHAPVADYTKPVIFATVYH